MPILAIVFLLVSLGRAEPQPNTWDSNGEAFLDRITINDTTSGYFADGYDYSEIKFERDVYLTEIELARIYILSENGTKTEITEPVIAEIKILDKNTVMDKDYILIGANTDNKYTLYQELLLKAGRWYEIQVYLDWQRVYGLFSFDGEYIDNTGTAQRSGAAADSVTAEFRKSHKSENDAAKHFNRIRSSGIVRRFYVRKEPSSKPYIPLTDKTNFDASGFAVVDRAVPNHTAKPGHYKDAVDRSFDYTKFTVVNHDIYLTKIELPQLYLLSHIGEKIEIINPMKIEISVYDGDDQIDHGYLEITTNGDNTYTFAEELLLKANHAFQIVVKLPSKLFGFDGWYKFVKKCAIIESGQTANFTMIDFKESFRYSGDDSYDRKQAVGGLVQRLYFNKKN